MKKLLLSLIAMMSVVLFQVKAETLPIVRNSNSGIKGATYTGTLSDGTILGFSSSFYLAGIITSDTEVVVPDSVMDGSTIYAIKRVNELDLTQAAHITSLTLPSSITSISKLHSQITDLHLLSSTSPSLNGWRIPSNTTVWVSREAYDAYKKLTRESGNAWCQADVHYEGWVPRSVTVTINNPGSFSQILLSQVEQFSDVDELIVIGELNDSDLSLFNRLVNAVKIDLSQAIVNSICGFRDLTALKTLLLPSTVIDVQKYAFSGSAIRNISIPNAINIDQYAFEKCYYLESISLPSAINIGYYAFNNCSSLTSVSLPSAISIDSYAFVSCSSITSVSLPSATSIGINAFEYCFNIASVYFPSVISIERGAFNSSSLTSVSLPASLQELGSSCFNCSGLQDVYCKVAAPLPSTAFGSNLQNITLHVPAFSVGAYSIHQDWYKAKKIVALEDNIDRMNIVSDFQITDFRGVTNKPDLSILSYTTSSNLREGHLTISADTPWSIGRYYQSHSNYKQQKYNSTTGKYYDYYLQSTLIANSQINAEEITVSFVATEQNRWYFITFPFDVNVADIQFPEDVLWVIRKYSGENRAKMSGDTWQNMTDGMILKAGEGYILQCKRISGSSSSNEFIFKAIDNSNKNKIFAYQDVTKPLSVYPSEFAHNRNWNLVGNPYPCYFNSQYIDHNGIITVWNGNGYTAYSLVDDQYVLRPHEAFFVQCPADATSMTFSTAGRSHKYEIDPESKKAATRGAGSASQRSVYNLALKGKNYTDKTRVVINDQAMIDYEISCDASKFMSSDTSVPQLYVLENGQKMSIDERPIADGILSLGVYFGEEGEYTLALAEGSEDDMQVLLSDNATDSITDLTQQSYTFTAAQGEDDSRFIILLSAKSTGIENLGSEDKEDKAVIYNLNGQQLQMLQNGANIVNGKKLMVK